MEEILVYLRILQKRWIPASIVFVIVFLLVGWNRARKTVPLYRATGTIVFQSSRVNITDPFSLSGTKLNNDLVLIKSDSLAERVRGDLEFPIEMDNRGLLRELEAVNPDKSDVIQLSYTHRNPEKASAIVNTWIKKYAELDRELKLNQTRELANFLQEQIPKSQVSLESTAEQLKDFKQDNRILDIGAEASSTTNILAQLDSQIAQTKAELASEKSRRDALRNIFPVDSELAITSTFVNESPLVNSLLKEIKDVETKIEQEKLRFGDNHPQVVTLEEEKRVLERQLANYAQNTSVNNIANQDLDSIYQPGNTQNELVKEYAATERNIKSLNAKLESLENLINFYRQRVDTLPNLEFRQQQIQRELGAKDELLQSLIKNYQDAQIALNNTEGNIRHIELAQTPTKPSIDRKFTYLVQGFLAGIFLGSLVAYLIEQLDQGINNVEQIKEFFDQPILAKVPDFYKVKSSRNDRKKDKEEISELPTRDNPSSPVSENFRALCTSIEFMQTADKPLKVITVSSSVAGEGKSTIAANMAVAAAGLDKKVLLIEADLRKPGQRKIWEGLNEKAGLSDLLQTDNQLKSSECVVNVFSTLDVLTAGNNKSNPVALIGSPQMVHLLEDLEQVYDLIIIDCPPVSVAADAQILGRMSDGMLMVVRQKKVNTSMLSIVKDSLEQAEVNVIGLALNCFTSDRSNYYYYYYNYSYYYNNDNENNENGDRTKKGKQNKKNRLFG